LSALHGIPLVIGLELSVQVEIFTGRVSAVVFIGMTTWTFASKDYKWNVI